MNPYYITKTRSASRRLGAGLRLLSLIAVAGTAARADYVPIALTPGSYNASMVVPANAPPAASSFTTATLDKGTNNFGTTFFEQGWYPGMPPTYGFPHPGSTLVSLVDGTHRWVMPPSYTANCAVFVGGELGDGTPQASQALHKATGTLNFTTPSAWTQLSILYASGGSNYIDCVITFSDTSTETHSFGTIPYTTTTPASPWITHGTVDVGTGVIGNVNSATLGRLYNADFALVNSATTVASVTLNFHSYGSGSTNRSFFFAVSGSPDNGTNWTTIPLTGFNSDPIVESAAGAQIFAMAPNYSTFTIDNGPLNYGNTFFEKGLDTANPNRGMPTHGALITNHVSNAFSTRVYQMPSTYVGKDCLGLGPYASFNWGNWTNGNLVLATRSNYQAMAVACSAGNGPANITYTVMRDDGSTNETGYISIPDWFQNTTTYLWTNYGRFTVDTLAFANSGTTSAALLYSVDLTNVSAVSTANVTNIFFNYTNASGRCAIFALCGSNAFTGAYFAPVALNEAASYNADSVIESDNRPAWQPNPAGAFQWLGKGGLLTATMDGGTNITGNTWYERGYNPPMGQSGLPAAGSVINSLSDSTKHYQFAPSYNLPNTIYVDTAHTNANLTLTTPSNYTGIAVLDASANGTVTVRAIMQYQNGTAETNQFTTADWFNGTPFAYTAQGRINVQNRQYDRDPGRIDETVVANQNPRLYEQFFALGSLNSPLTNILLQYISQSSTGNGRAAIMAVSGTTNPVVPTFANGAGLIPGSTNTVATAAFTETVGTVRGSQPFTYTWQAGAIGSGVFTNLADAGDVTGSTTAVLSFSSASFADTGDYRLVIANGAGSITSSVATIQVSDPGFIGSSGLVPGSSNMFESTYIVETGSPAGGTPPITYQWMVAPLGSSAYVNVTDGGNISGSQTRSLTNTSISHTQAGNYVLVASGPGGSVTSSVAILQVVSGLSAIPLPGDPITAFGGTSPAAETVDHSIDDLDAKYLNFGSGPNNANPPFVGPVGFVVTPSRGFSTVQVMRLYTANDTQGRDPADYVLEGSVDGGATWTTVSAGALALPAGRNTTTTAALNPFTQFMQEVYFNNSASYGKYRWTVNNVETPASVNSMQIGEVELLGNLNAVVAPVITRQPAAASTVFVGGSPSVSILAGGQPAVAYQWYTANDGQPISGATASSYTKSNAQLSDTGRKVYCQVSNSGGTVNSATNTLTVIAAPTSPYAVAVKNDAPFAWWRLGESDDGNCNNGTVAMDSWGGHNGAYANVQLGSPGYRGNDPDGSAIFGSGASPCAAASGSLVQSIPGVDFATAANGAFSVEAWVLGGSQTSGAGIVTKGPGGSEQFNLDCGGPSSNFRFYARLANGANNPVNGTVGPSPTVWHHVVGVCDQANGQQYLYVDGLLNASATLTVGGGILTQPAQASIGSRQSAPLGGTYDLQFNGNLDEVVIYNYALSSNQVAAHFLAAGSNAPVFVQQPPSTQNASEGQTIVLQSRAFGSLPLSYQWYNDLINGPIAGATSNNLRIVNVPASDNGVGFWVVASNAYGTVTSTIDTLTVVSGPPQLLNDLQPFYVVYAGNAVLLEADFGGTAPLSYQWQYNGANMNDSARISGSHSNILAITPSYGSDSGLYQLLVTNNQGNNQSSVAQVEVEVVADFNTNGTGWTVTGSGSYNNDVYTITTGGGQQSAAWYNTPQYCGGFYASFTYQDTTGLSGADGACFVLQNDLRGTSAIGSGGGGLGYGAPNEVTPSVAFEINIYNGHVQGFGFGANGSIANPFVQGNVNPANGNPVNVTMLYARGVLTVNVFDTVTLAADTFTQAVNIPAVLGTQCGLIGITGGSGSVGSTQTVGNFAYWPIPTLTATASGNNILLTWPGCVGGYILQQENTLTGTWSDVATVPSTVGANWQVSVPNNGTQQFFRLRLLLQ